MWAPCSEGMLPGSWGGGGGDRMGQLLRYSPPTPRATLLGPLKWVTLPVTIPCIRCTYPYLKVHDRWPRCRTYQLQIRDTKGPESFRTVLIHNGGYWSVHTAHAETEFDLISFSFIWKPNQYCSGHDEYVIFYILIAFIFFIVDPLKSKIIIWQINGVLQLLFSDARVSGSTVL
jgi:hypothetical protein